MRGALLVAAFAALCACGGDDEAIDATPAIDAADGVDARVIDAAVVDGGIADARVIDAAIADAGVDGPAFGVPCGSDGELCVPGASLGCCSDEGDAAPACEPLGGLCLGDLQSCDGPEDCTRDSLCCDFGFAPTCADPNDCTSDLGGTVICHGDADCPQEAPACCDGRCGEQGCP